ncbi:MAG TPA: hypothetical protein VI172_08205 [Candidatus Dormibacteraeota bacterium]
MTATAPNPAELAEALRLAGWEIASHKPGRYVRLSWPDRTDRTLTIPLDETAGDFNDLMHAAVCHLEATMFAGRDAAKALAAYRPDLYGQYV